MLVLDREDAIAAWRRAEARIYPTVMVNPALYEQYMASCAPSRTSSRDVRTDDDLVDGLDRATRHRRGGGRAPRRRCCALMDLAAVRDAAFCHRHRELTRERGQAIARRAPRGGAASGAEWVVLFEDVTPLGSHRLEMHVRERPRAAPRVRAADSRSRRRRSSSRSSSSTRATARGCSTSRRLMPAQTLRHPRGVGGAHRAGPRDLRKGLTDGHDAPPARSSTRTATSARSRRGSSTTSSTR